MLHHLDWVSSYVYQDPVSTLSSLLGALQVEMDWDHGNPRMKYGVR